MIFSRKFLLNEFIFTQQQKKRNLSLFLININLFFLEFITTPAVRFLSANGLWYSGCQFKYHQFLEAAHFRLYNVNRKVIKELRAEVTIDEDDTYKFRVLRISNYGEVGDSLNCRLLYENIDGINNEVISDSVNITVSCKFSLLFI